MTHRLSSFIHRNLNLLFCEIKPYLNPLIFYYLSTVYKIHILNNRTTFVQYEIELGS